MDSIRSFCKQSIISITDKQIRNKQTLTSCKNKRKPIYVSSSPPHGRSDHEDDSPTSAARVTCGSSDEEIDSPEIRMSDENLSPTPPSTRITCQTTDNDADDDDSPLITKKSKMKKRKLSISEEDEDEGTPITCRKSVDIITSTPRRKLSHEKAVEKLVKCSKAIRSLVRGWKKTSLTQKVLESYFYFYNANFFIQDFHF